jgi:ATP-dependent DNA helicase RecG
LDSEKLKLLIAEGEGLTVEFKERYTAKIDRDIVAFANTKGGYILLGVADDGRITGQKLNNKIKSEIHSLARNCEPLVNISRILQIANVAVVEVLSGEEKPYSCSSGYFRRLDAVTQKMSHKEIKNLFQGEPSVSFEERFNKDAQWDDISEEKIRTFFNEADIKYSKIEPKSVLSSLNLSKNNDIKNAAVLFFSQKPRKLLLQCQMTLVAFKGTGRVNIYDRKDIQDDLLTQFNEAILFLKKHLNIRSEINGVNRKDVYEIPLEALREAVANAIIHRDYSVRGTSITIEVHSDKVVISNPGGLPCGFSLKSLLNISVRRNELIADMFARMHKVERLGTGIKRMAEVMKKAGLAGPKIKSDMFFTITFQRPLYYSKQNESSEKSSVKGSEKSSVKILNAILADKFITADKLAQLLGISQRAVEKQIAKLKAENKLRRIGPAKGGHWEVDDKTDNIKN